MVWEKARDQLVHHCHRLVTAEHRGSLPTREWAMELPAGGLITPGQGAAGVKDYISFLKDNRPQMESLMGNPTSPNQDLTSLQLQLSQKWDVKVHQGSPDQQE